MAAGRLCRCSLLNDDLVRFASNLSADNRARLLKLLQDDSDVVHLDNDRVSLVPQVPKDAKPFSDFVEFVMPSEHYLCGVHALKVSLSVISGKPHVALASKMRDTLVELPVLLAISQEKWERVPRDQRKNARNARGKHGHVKQLPKG